MTMLEVVRQAVEAARKAGADYADARWVLEENESITVKNEEMEGIDRSRSDGIGIRVLAGGFWGFRPPGRGREPGRGGASRAFGRGDRRGRIAAATRAGAPGRGRAGHRHVGDSGAGGPLQCLAGGEGLAPHGG